MPVPKRKWMVKALREHLIPVFQSQGFVLVPVAKDDSREMRSAMQLGYLKRQKPLGIEQIEIQMSEAPRSSFSVRFGFIFKEGITIKNEGWKSAEVLGVSESKITNSLCWRPRTVTSQTWWVFYWPWQKPKYEDYVALANRVAKLAPEVEDYFQTGHVGPHVRQLDLGFLSLDWVKIGKHDPIW